MHGIKLLLVARDRVLSLSERRVCGPLPVPPFLMDFIRLWPQ